MKLVSLHRTNVNNYENVARWILIQFVASTNNRFSRFYSCVMGGYLTIKNINQLHLYFIFVKCVLDFKPNLLSGQTARVETKESRVKRVKSRNLVHQQENSTSSCYDISFKHFLSILSIPFLGCVSTLFPLYLESSRPLPPLPHTRSRAREKKAGNLTRLTRLHIAQDFILAYFKKSLGFYSGILFPKGRLKNKFLLTQVPKGKNELTIEVFTVQKKRN